MATFDLQNMQIGDGALAALTDSKPAAVRIDVLATGDDTTGGVGKFLLLESAGADMLSIDLDGTVNATKFIGTTKRSIQIVIDGGGTEITDGIKGDFMMPYAATISKVTALADQSGSIVVDVWNDTYANYPPTDADTITASAPITISSATKSQDSTLTGWDTALAAGDILRFNVDSCTTITRVTINIEVSEV